MLLFNNFFVSINKHKCISFMDIFYLVAVSSQYFYFFNINVTCLMSHFGSNWYIRSQIMFLLRHNLTLSKFTREQNFRYNITISSYISDKRKFKTSSSLIDIFYRTESSVRVHFHRNPLQDYSQHFTNPIYNGK